MISWPCEPVLMLESFLSVCDIASYYHIWHMQTFDMRRKVSLKRLWSENRTIIHSGSLVVRYCQVHYRRTLFRVLFSFVCSAIMQSARMITKIQQWTTVSHIPEIMRDDIQIHASRCPWMFPFHCTVPISRLMDILRFHVNCQMVCAKNVKLWIILKMMLT